MESHLNHKKSYSIHEDFLLVQIIWGNPEKHPTWEPGCVREWMARAARGSSPLWNVNQPPSRPRWERECNTKKIGKSENQKGNLCSTRKRFPSLSPSLAPSLLLPFQKVPSFLFFLFLVFFLTVYRTQHKNRTRAKFCVSEGKLRIISTYL